MIFSVCPLDLLFQLFFYVCVGLLEKVGVIGALLKVDQIGFIVYGVGSLCKMSCISRWLHNYFLLIQKWFKIIKHLLMRLIITLKQHFQLKLLSHNYSNRKLTDLIVRNVVTNNCLIWSWAILIYLYFKYKCNRKRQ